MRNHSNRFIVVTNSRASALLTERGESRLETQVLRPLQHFGKKIVELATPSTDDMSEVLEEGDTIVSCGGDGTTNWLMNALHKISATEHVTLVPQPFGGANDIASGLYGTRRLDQIIDQAMPSIAYAISATIEQPQVDHEPKTVHALGYIGVGASGAAAAAINSDRTHMQRHKVVARAAKAVMATRQFNYLDDSGCVQTGFEWLALNGRMSYAIQPWRDYYFENAHQQVFARNRLEAFGKIGLSVGRFVRGELLAGEATTTMQPLQNVLLQADGESQTIAPCSTLTIHNGPAIRLAKL